MITSSLIKSLALELGFDLAGIARIEPLSGDASYLKKWLEEGNHAEMKYLENHFDKRENPALLVDAAKSVLVLGMSYHPKEWLFDHKSFRIASYAYGLDYHHIIKYRIQILLSRLQEIDPTVSGRCFTDSAPVFERRWAQKAGLGWIGKNGCLINKKMGSMFFIGELFLNLDLEADAPFEKNHCGSCTACIDACPTKAFNKNYNFDSRKCLSYHTIENKGEIPQEIKRKANSNVFGCDICQRVCPWNQQKEIPKERFFNPSDFTGHLLSLNNPNELKECDFQTLRKGTPFERIKFLKWQQNCP